MMHAALNPRRTCQPVRRDSFDVDDPRAQVFRPIEGGIQFVDAYIKVFTEWADETKEKGKAHLLTANCRRVLEVLLRRCTDFKSGTCEPSLDTLMRHTRFARATIVRALKILFKAGFIDWIRRTIRTGIPAGEGPQVKQTSNAYFFDLSRLPSGCMMRLRQLVERTGKVFSGRQESRKPFYEPVRTRRLRTLKERREGLAKALAGAPPAQQARLLYPDDPASQATYIEMLGGQGASSAASLNPSPRTRE